MVMLHTVGLLIRANEPPVLALVIRGLPGNFCKTAGLDTDARHLLVGFYIKTCSHHARCKYLKYL
jgi:hypothetical protein